MQNLYDENFYNQLQAGSYQSAKIIIPLVLELMQLSSEERVKTKSVVDVGCGDGTWLSVFKEYGFQDCLGIDGDYVNSEILKIPQSEFFSMDLKSPLNINRQFDLVVSLEVAEHLPLDCAEVFIDFLTKLGSLVLFSAAIPYQGGTEHINEQWPEYWAAYFKHRGYQVIDCLRKKIWNDDRVEAWYAQNILFFVKTDCLEKYPLLAQELKNYNHNPSQLALVHPKIYFNKVQQTNPIAPQRPSQLTSFQTELKVNENRFGCLEIKITNIQLLPNSEIFHDDFLSIVIEYEVEKPIYSPIFVVNISQKNGEICWETDTQKLKLPLLLLKEKGKITLPLGQLNLESGHYFVNIKISDRHWSLIYDYHYQVYPLLIKSPEEDSLDKTDIELANS